MLVFFFKTSIFHQTWFFAVHVLGDLANAACSPRRTWGSLGAAQVFKLLRGQLEVRIREKPSELVEVPEVWGHQQVWEMSWEMAVEHGMALAEAGSEPGSHVATGCVHVVSPASCPWAVCVEHAGRRTGWTIFFCQEMWLHWNPTVPQEPIQSADILSGAVRKNGTDYPLSCQV